MYRLPSRGFGRSVGPALPSGYHVPLAALTIEPARRLPPQGGFQP